jgi:hypothetical protein
MRARAPKKMFFHLPPAFGGRATSPFSGSPPGSCPTVAVRLVVRPLNSFTCKIIEFMLTSSPE